MQVKSQFDFITQREKNDENNGGDFDNNDFNFYYLSFANRGN